MSYIEFLDSSPMTKFLWVLVTLAVLAQLLDGMDFEMTTYALPGIIREFHLNPAQAGAAASVVNIGMIIGGIVFSLIADRFGRKPIFSWALLIFAVGSLLSALAPTYNSLLVARLIAGVGLGAEPPVATAILAEYAPRRYRHLFVTMVPVAYSAGWVVAALISIRIVPTHGWRAIYWVGVIPALLIVAARYFMPESIRWLLTKGRIEEAGHIANDLARRAGRVELQLVPPETRKNQFKLNFGQQLKLTRKFLLPTLVVAFVYFCFYIQSRGVNAWLPTILMRQGFTMAKSFKLTMIIYSVSPVSALLAGVLEDRMNRKNALLLIVMVGTVLFVFFGLSFQYRWPVQIMVGAQLLNTLIVQGVIPILYTLTAEIFPTPVRSFGVALALSLGRFGSVAGPYALGLLLYFGTHISMIIYMLAVPLLVSSILAALVLKHDPRQRSVEEISAEAMGESTRAAAAR